MQLMEAQSILAQLGEDSHVQWVRYFATYQKVMATIANDMLAQGDETATLPTLFRGMRDGIDKAVYNVRFFGTEVKRVFRQAKKDGLGLFDIIARVGKGTYRSFAVLSSSLRTVLAPLFSIGVTAMPEIIKLFNIISESIEDAKSASYKGLSDELKEVRIRAEEAGEAIKGVVDAQADLTRGVSVLLKTSFTSDLEKFRNEYSRALIQLDAARANIKNRIESDFDFDNAMGFGVNPKTPDFDDPDSIPSIVLQEHIQPFLEKYNAAYTNFATEAAKRADALVESLQLESDRLKKEQLTSSS